MLSLPDTNLIQRDKAIVGMKNVLDQNAFFTTLQNTLPNLNATSAELTYLRYRPTRSCLGAYQIKTQDSAQPVRAHITAFNAKAWHKLMAHNCHHKHLVSQEKMLISLFPEDTQLTSLAQLMNQNHRQSILNKLLPAGLEEKGIERYSESIETLAYKPERRYVGQIQLEQGTRVLLKHYRQREYRKSAIANHIHCSTTGRLRIPTTLGQSQHHQSLLFEWLPGRLLDTEIMTNPTTHSLYESGAALAEFHSLPSKGLTHYTSHLKTKKLTAMAETIKQIYPPLALLSKKIACFIIQKTQQSPSDICRIHGDFYPKQVVLMERGQVAIIDHDENLLGNPLEDLGLFIAHLLRDKCYKQNAHQQVDSLIEAFLEGYYSTSQTPVSNLLRYYVAAGLFSLTHSPFRRHTLNWPEETQIMLELINEILHSPYPSIEWARGQRF